MPFCPGFFTEQFFEVRHTVTSVSMPPPLLHIATVARVRVTRCLPSHLSTDRGAVTECCNNNQPCSLVTLNSLCTQLVFTISILRFSHLLRAKQSTGQHMPRGPSKQTEGPCQHVAIWRGVAVSELQRCQALRAPSRSRPSHLESGAPPRTPQPPPCSRHPLGRKQGNCSY